MNYANPHRLEPILAEYLAAVDAGDAPDRAALLARHPDFASDLERFFANLDRMESLAAPLRPEPAATAAETMAKNAAGGPGATLPGNSQTAGGAGTESEPAIGDGPGRGDRIRYFGDYELLDELGRGGMGVVFRARQVSLNRLVALKIIRSADLSSAVERRRFQNEAEVVAQLDHPQIVPIFEVGEFDQRPYFSMKLIVGHGLDALKDRYRSDPHMAARMVSSIAKAVHHAHQRGILHRDLKPSNVLVDADGQPHVTDFGLAKKVAADSAMTHSGAIMGTPAYMAPEQASGQRGHTTTVSDVYGLGALLYDLLTGRPPFRGDSVLDTLKLVQEQEPAPVRPQNGKVDLDLETVCLKCLEKAPRRRYASAEELAKDLDRWLAGEPIAARPSSPPERVWKWVRRHPAVSGLAASLALALVIGLAAVSTLYLRAEAARKLAADRLIAESIARRQAESSEARAVKARHDAEEAGAAAVTARTRAESSLYANRIQLAYQYWDRGNIVQAERLLDACPEPLRQWEWRYLKHLGHTELFSLPTSGQLISSLAFSGDGRRLAAVANTTNAGAQVWDLDARKPLTEIRTFRPNRKGVFTAAALSPDGKTLALGDNSGQVALYSADTGQAIKDVGKLEGNVGAIDFSPDGSLLAAARADRRNGGVLVTALDPRIKASLKVWKLSDGAVVFEPANVGGVAAFSPDGRFLLSLKLDTALRFIPSPPFSAALWKVGDWSALRTFEPINSWSFSRDGTRLAVAGRVTGTRDHFLKVMEVESGTEVFATRPSYPEGDIALSPDGLTLAAARGFRNEFDLWDLKSKAIVRTYRGHSLELSTLTFTPDGARIVTAAWDHTIRFWDPKTDQVAYRPTDVHPVSVVSDAAIRPDGRQMAFVQGDNVGGLFNPGAVVILFDPWTGKLVKAIPRAHPQGARRLAYSADGTTLVSGGREGKVLAWDARTGAPIGSFAGHDGRIEALAVSPDGRWVASAHEPAEYAKLRERHSMPAGFKSPTGEVKVWDAKSGSIRHTIHAPKHCYTCAFSPDGSSLVTVEHDSVKLWDLASGAERWAAAKNASMPDRVAFNFAGSILAVFCSDTLILLDAATGRERIRLPGQSRITTGAMAFSPDDRRLAVARSNEVKLWDVADGHEILTLPRLPGPANGNPVQVSALAFSPDGRRLIAALYDGGVEVWQ